jgi:hypothetical protein
MSECWKWLFAWAQYVLSNQSLAGFC